MGLRVLFTTQPGVGHLHPLVPVADGLRARGHDVRVASSRSFGPAIAAAGHVPVPVGRDWLTTAMPEAFPEIAAIPPDPSATRAVERRCSPTAPLGPPPETSPPTPPSGRRT